MAWLRVTLVTDSPGLAQSFERYKALIDTYLYKLSRKYLGRPAYVKESRVGFDPEKKVYYLRIIIEEGEK